MNRRRMLLVRREVAICVAFRDAFRKATPRVCHPPCDPSLRFSCFQASCCRRGFRQLLSAKPRRIRVGCAKDLPQNEQGCLRTRLGPTTEQRPVTAMAGEIHRNTMDSGGAQGLGARLWMGPGSLPAWRPYLDAARSRPSSRAILRASRYSDLVRGRLSSGYSSARWAGRYCAITLT